MVMDDAFANSTLYGLPQTATHPTKAIVTIAVANKRRVFMRTPDFSAPPLEHSCQQVFVIAVLFRHVAGNLHQPNSKLVSLRSH